MKNFYKDIQSYKIVEKKISQKKIYFLIINKMDNKIAELAEQISIIKRQLTKAINSGNEAKALKLIKIKEELDKDFEELLQQVAIAEERERKAEEESHNEIEDERVETEHKTGSGMKKIHPYHSGW